MDDLCNLGIVLAKLTLVIELGLNQAKRLIHNGFRHV